MEEQKRNKYLLGIIGATIGAFIGVIPWILVYIYGNMIVALLSILVAVGSYQGYRITKATIDKKLPVIVAITSVLAITVATFIIIPLGLFAKEELGATFENLEFIYGESEFKRAIIGDYVISLLFTVLGIGGIISNLHKQIKEGANKDEKDAFTILYKLGTALGFTFEKASVSDEATLRKDRRRALFNRTGND